MYADRGYPSGEREAWLKENGFRNQIQRKDKRIAKTCAQVEHVFSADGQMGSKLLHTIGQARANFAMSMMAVCYNLKRLAYFQEAGIKAF